MIEIEFQQITTETLINERQWKRENNEHTIGHQLMSAS